MNNYYYIAITKAIAFFKNNDFDSVEACVNEFVDMQIPAKFILDNQESAIKSARENDKIPSDLIDIFEEVMG